MAGWAFNYIISPFLDDLYGKAAKKYRWIICIALSILFIIDLIWSIVSPNVGNGVTSGLV
jgi:hypothetical protein